MVYISRLRRHDEDARRREEIKDRAARVGDLRGRYIEWAKVHGIPRAEVERELRKVDEAIEHMQEHAEGAV